MLGTLPFCRGASLARGAHPGWVGKRENLVLARLQPALVSAERLPGAWGCANIWPMCTQVFREEGLVWWRKARDDQGQFTPRRELTVQLEVPFFRNYFNLRCLKRASSLISSGEYLLPLPFCKTQTCLVFQSQRVYILSCTVEFTRG